MESEWHDHAYRDEDDRDRSDDQYRPTWAPQQGLLPGGRRRAALNQRRSSVGGPLCDSVALGRLLGLDRLVNDALGVADVLGGVSRFQLGLVFVGGAGWVARVGGRGVECGQLIAQRK